MLGKCQPQPPFLQDLVHSSGNETVLTSGVIIGLKQVEGVGLAGSAGGGILGTGLSPVAGS